MDGEIGKGQIGGGGCELFKPNLIRMDKRSSEAAMGRGHYIFQGVSQLL
jgi:hypothetical protein